jgi:hypothetical protein
MGRDPKRYIKGNRRNRRYRWPQRGRKCALQLEVERFVFYAYSLPLNRKET